MLIFIEKKTNRKEAYGSLVELYKHEGHLIRITLDTMNNKRNLNLEDYEDENCEICKRSIKRSKHSQFL
jgi:hypothetical protein